MSATPRTGPPRFHGAPPRGARNALHHWRRLETWLWTGPAGHLLGGTLDYVQALARYLRQRKRTG